MWRILLENLRFAWQDWRRGRIDEDNFVPRLRLWWQR